MPQKPMITILLALLAGMILGAIFTAIKLPLPAPPTLAGIMGIVGIFLGGHTYQWITRTFFH
jgi:XapX domain-containing protein